MLLVRVLVVEDDDSVRALLTEFLKSRQDVEVHSARDGVEALHQLSRAPYDLIVLDLMMPKMSGVDFLDSLKALTSDPSVKSVEKAPAVIVITGAPAATLPNDAIEHRFPQVVRGVFRKPLDIERFAGCVDEILRPGSRAPGPEMSARRGTRDAGRRT
jgi:CheY-like chemotaxis protein